MRWNTNMDEAPKDGTVLNVVAQQYPGDMAFPTYANFVAELGGWYELSAYSQEQELMVWAWRHVDDFPDFPDPDGTHPIINGLMAAREMGFVSDKTHEFAP